MCSRWRDESFASIISETRRGRDKLPGTIQSLPLSSPSGTRDGLKCHLSESQMLLRQPGLFKAVNWDRRVQRGFLRQQIPKIFICWRDESGKTPRDRSPVAVFERDSGLASSMFNWFIHLFIWVSWACLQSPVPSSNQQPDGCHSSSNASKLSAARLTKNLTPNEAAPRRGLVNTVSNVDY